MANKIYCGNGKEFRFSNGGSKLSMSICLDDIPQEHITTGRNGKRYVSIDICENKDGANQWGKTHYAEVNTWKPDGKQKNKPASPESFDSDIPF